MLIVSNNGMIYCVIQVYSYINYDSSLISSCSLSLFLLINGSCVSRQIHYCNILHIYSSEHRSHCVLYAQTAKKT